MLILSFSKKSLLTLRVHLSETLGGLEIRILKTNLLGTILAKLPIQYKYTDNFKGIVTVRAPESDSLIHFVGKKLDNQYHQDVGLIAKIAGSNNENYLFLVGFAFPSQIETVRLLSRPDQLSKLYAQTVGDKILFPKHFIVILEILCTEFSAIDTKVKYFREIPSTAPR